MDKAARRSCATGMLTVRCLALFAAAVMITYLSLKHAILSFTKRIPKAAWILSGRE